MCNGRTRRSFRSAVQHVGSRVGSIVRVHRRASRRALEHQRAGQRDGQLDTHLTRPSIDRWYQGRALGKRYRRASATGSASLGRTRIEALQASREQQPDADNRACGPV